jgi:hypothetical protein
MHTFLDAVEGAMPPAVGGAIKMTRAVAPRVIDLLDRPRQAMHAAIAGDDPLRTFIHHASQAQQDRNRAVVRDRIGMPGAAERAEGYGFRGGFDDFLTDTLTDPVSYASAGIAPLVKLLGRGAAAGVRALERVAPKAVGEAREYGQAATDAFTFGGPAKRTLGPDRFHGAVLADNRQEAREIEGARRLTERFDQTIATLPDAERLSVYQVLNGERDTRGMPPHLIDVIDAAKKLRNDAGALWSDASGRRKLAYGGGRLAQRDVAFRMNPPTRSAPEQDGYGGTLDALIRAAQETKTQVGRKGFTGPNAIGMTHADDVKPAAGPRRLVGRVDRGYEIPPELRDFAAPADQGILKAGNVRANYLPGPRTGEDLVSENIRPKAFNLLAPFAPNALRRESFTVDEKSLPAIDDAFRGMLSQAARQGTAGRLRDEVGVRLGGNADPALLSLFERQPRARGDARTTLEKLGQRAQQIVEIPKNTVTTLGLVHGLKNVPELAYQSEGAGAAAESLIRGTQLAGKNPGDRYEAMREAVEAGLIAPSDVRDNPIANTLARLPLVGPTIGKASLKANDLTWAIDDASKLAVYKRKLARGMKPEDAATETLREMIDYRHRSPATQAMSKIAPFATFRMGIPGAIASDVVRRPDRLLRGDRATGGLLSNAHVDVQGPDGKRHRITMTTPTSDVLELGDEPQRYGRAMLADPLKALLSPIALPTRRRDPETGEMVSRLQPSYTTYGQPLLPHHDKNGKIKAGFMLQQLAGYAPLSIGGQALNALQAGEFPPEDILSALLGSTVGAHVR